MFDNVNDWRELANIIADCERASTKLEMIRGIYMDDKSTYFGPQDRTVMRILGIDPDERIYINKKAKEAENDNA